MKNITRSFTTTYAKVKVYNEASDSIDTITATLDGKYDCDSFKKAYAKIETRVVLKVYDATTVDELFGMDENVFLANGHAFSERSKENRGMITKTVSKTVYTVKVYDFDTDTITEKIFVGDSVKDVEKQLPTNYKLLKVVGESKVDSLIGMTVEEFRSYARPMIDHFHYKD